MPINLQNCEAPISNTEFDEFTKSIGSMPSKYFRDFYIANNGGTLDESTIENNAFLLNSFLSIKNGEATIEDTYKQLIKGQPDLINLIPFAYDDCGNIFALSTRNEDSGLIYLWLADEKELLLISNSFEEFLTDLEQ
ncbi:SMI1/KNR4 family protein [Pseudomonas sp. MWU16-30323]|uniref:SMI1/KNR4 family protein n=1 Tax=Pseudomonas sp. MWU16-30323 TaxID=2878094 RepID=UPI001CFC1D1A|nr:SMI1/KNR4 family protein [Pseudomonas sp. MWU16-30323]